MSLETCKRVLLKLIQIGINVICAALLLKYNCIPKSPSFLGFAMDDYTRTYIVVGVVGGYMLISTLILLSYPMEGVGKAPILETLMMAVGGGLSIAAAGLMLDYYINEDKTDSDRDKTGTAVGSLQALNGLIYLIDALVVFRSK